MEKSESIDHNVFLLLDAARAGDHFDRCIALDPGGRSLYAGKEQRALLRVAPYLFNLEDRSPLANFFFDKGWNDAWGTIVFSRSEFSVCYHHFKKFLFVKTEEGKKLYFRFYDPRVLKMFLPTCDRDQVSDFFGPITGFLVKGQSKEDAVLFKQQRGVLTQMKLMVKEIF